MKEDAPFVSVVVPCRNERAHIRRCLDSLIRSTHPKERLEVTFVDGMSTDGTRRILEEYARAHGFRVLDNPKVVAPAALNIGIARSRGEIIVRMDAHAEFPDDYIPRLIRLLRESRAGNAGGRVVNVPNGEHPWARAVAYVTAHRFGVGDSAWRTSERPGFVDTVPGGAYPREVLERVGPFDERLTRNQDNELNSRLLRLGYRIAFDPGIRIKYWNQGTLRGLLRQGWHTGLWNVYTLRLHAHTWKTSRFVPGAFVAYLAAALPAAALAPSAGLAALASGPAALYVLLLALSAAGARRAQGGPLRAALTFAGYHLAYGAGTLTGVVNLVTGRWRAHLGRPIRK